MTDLERAVAAGGQVQQPQAQPQTDLERALAAGGEVHTPETPSTLEAIGRGALQGASLGFSDEITGALESIFSDKSYAVARDEARAANAAAAEAHPVASTAAELAAGIATPVPGLGAIKGAGVAAHAARAAVAGGTAGLGASNADLTKGEFHQALNDTIESTLLGGAIGAVGGKIGQKLGKASEKADDLAIKALAGGESHTSGAAWQKTRRMVNNPNTKSILREPVEVETAAGKTKTTTLEKVAGHEPDQIEDLVSAQTQKINDEIRPIYKLADQKNGGVPLDKYITHLNDRIHQVEHGDPGKGIKAMAPAEAKVYKGALSELRDNALEQWGQRPTIPSDEVRAEATALQKIGFKTVDPLNPGLSTQVKRDMGNMVRDFVNDHVMETLGPEHHASLKDLNRRMNAWLGVGTVAGARAEKAAAGRMSAKGGIADLLGHGGLVGAGAMAMHGNIPGAVAAVALPKVIEHAPAAIRGVARGAAKVDAKLKAVAEAAKAGNPFAQKLLAQIKQAPGGVARVAALENNRAE